MCMFVCMFVCVFVCVCGFVCVCVFVCACSDWLPYESIRVVSDLLSDSNLLNIVISS
jgi:hypothetical protein